MTNLAQIYSSENYVSKHDQYKQFSLWQYNMTKQYNIFLYISWTVNIDFCQEFEDDASYLLNVQANWLLL